MPNRIRHLAGTLLAACALLAALAAPAPGAQRQPSPNPLELRDLLMAERFHEVERRLVSYQRDFEAGADTEYLAAAGIWAFSTSDPALADPLDAWVAAMPESWAALTARGVYLERKGWLIRGTRFANETSEKRFAGMREQFELAERDLRAALDRNPHITPAYAVLISIAKATSRRSAIEDILAAGLEAEPASYIIRNTYLDTLEPKWGGSEGETKAFVDASQKWLDKNPDLKSLEVRLRLRPIEHLIHSKRYREALALLNPLVDEWASTGVLLARGRARYHLRDYDGALADLNRLLDHSPFWTDALNLRARVLARMDRNDEALGDHDLAVRLEPLDPGILRGRAYEYETQARFREAVRDLTDALVYGWDDAAIWARRGDLYADGLRDHESAVPDFEKSLELAPNKARTWYLYGRSLAALKQCKAIPAWTVYRRICDADKDCSDFHYGMIERKTARLIEEHGCKPADG